MLLGTMRQDKSSSAGQPALPASFHYLDDRWACYPTYLRARNDPIQGQHEPRSSTGTQNSMWIAVRACR